MLLHILIVEDNDFFLNANYNCVKQLAKKYGLHTKIQCFTYVGVNMNEYIRKNSIDIALLDIEIGKNNGIAVAQNIIKYQPLASIIFITAFGQYISKANHITPVGFIEKPVDIIKLEKLFYRCVMTKTGKNSIEEKNMKLVVFKRNRVNVEIRESEIIYIKHEDRKLHVVTKNDTILINSSIHYTASTLSEIFVKIARDIIVNKREVVHLVKGKITMSNGDILSIPLYKYSTIVNKIRS